MADEKPNETANGLVGLVVFGLVVCSIVYLLKDCSLFGFFRHGSQFGNIEGVYQKTSPKFLEAHKMDLIGKAVQVDFQLSVLDIQTEFSRLNLSPQDVYGVDILIPSESPIYDSIVAFNPKWNSEYIVYGTVMPYGNSAESIYIRPNGLVFK